jgi:hypothetical protein
MTHIHHTEFRDAGSADEDLRAAVDRMTRVALTTVTSGH